MQKVIIAGVNLNNDPDFEYHMDELEGLVRACDMEVAGEVTQNLGSINSATYVGTGKTEEIRAAADELGADAVVFDNSLKPSQLRNLQNELKLPVLDRTNVILEIFSRRARTKEARLQVELADLQYMLPRLTGMGEVLSRQGGDTAGGLANRGAGETKLELDRRKIEKRISELKHELEEIEENRATQRQKRSKSELPSAALVGYTNAGKSTLLNCMLDRYMNDADKKVLEKDMLFATLDTTVRRINSGDNRDFLLADTVGFIDRLPPTLVKAFRSTLFEACSADLLLLVADFSDPHYREQMKVTEDTLCELGAEKIPRIYIMNKSDLIMNKEEIPRITGNKIYMSAGLGLGTEELMDMIREILFADYVHCRMLIPYSDQAAVAYLKDNAVTDSLEYGPEGVTMQILCRKSDAGRYERYIETILKGR